MAKFCSFHSTFGVILHFEKSSNMAKIWQKNEEKLVRLAFNPFLHGTAGIPETQVSGTRSVATVYYSNKSNVIHDYANPPVCICIAELRKVHSRGSKLENCRILNGKNPCCCLPEMHRTLKSKKSAIWFCGVKFFQTRSDSEVPQE